MDTIRIPTPFRCIHLKAEPGSHLSLFEQEVLQKYESLHVFIANLSTGFKKWLKEAKEHQQKMIEFQPFVAEHIKEIKLYNDILTYNLADDVEITEFRLRPSVIKEAVLQFESRFTAFYQCFKPFVERFDDLEKDYETFEALFSEFDRKYFAPVIHNWQEMKIDSNTFDRDFDALREQLDDVEQPRDTAIDYNNTLPNEYNALCADVNKMYRALERMLENFDCVERIAKGEFNQLSALN